MKRSLWYFLGSITFGVVIPAWALSPVPPSTPSGAQVTEAYTATTITPASSLANSLGRSQRTFKANEDMRFGGIYYDPNPVCATEPTAPVREKIYVLAFDHDGKLVFYGLSGTIAVAARPTETQPSKEHRGIFLALTPVGSTFQPGTYTYTYLVHDCTWTQITIFPALNTFTILPE